MADASDVFAGIARKPGVRYTALVPNLAGLERAMAAGVSEIAIFAAASETFSQRNINQSIDQSLATYAAVCAQAAGAGIRVRGYLSTCFGCPFEGAGCAVAGGAGRGATARPRRVRGFDQRHHRRRASRAGSPRARCRDQRGAPRQNGVALPRHARHRPRQRARRSRLRRRPRSTVPPAGWGDVPSLQARLGTLRPKTCSTCWMDSGLIPVCPSNALSKARDSSRPGWITGCRRGYLQAAK